MIYIMSFMVNFIVQIFFSSITHCILRKISSKLRGHVRLTYYTNSYITASSNDECYVGAYLVKELGGVMYELTLALHGLFIFCATCFVSSLQNNIVQVVVTPNVKPGSPCNLEHHHSSYHQHSPKKLDVHEL